MPEVTVGEPIIDDSGGTRATTWPLRLKNNAPVVDIFGFSTQGIPPLWVSFDKLQVHLLNGASDKAHLTVRPSMGTRAGIYPFTLRVISFNNVSDRVELALSVEVPAVGLFTLSVSPSQAALQDGGVAALNVQLVAPATNNEDLTLGLEASDEEGLGEYTFEPRQVRLPPGDTKASILRIRPRTLLASDDPPRTFRVNVVAVSSAGKNTQNATVTVTQKAGRRPSLDLRPKVGRDERSFVYALTVINPSDADVTFTLAGSDPENSCEFDFQPPNVRAPKHASSEVAVRVTAKRTFDGSSDKVHPLTITATRNGDLLPVAQIEDGRFIQTPVHAVTLSLLQSLQEVHGGNSATYWVRINNPRSMAVQVALDIKDDEGALRCSLNPAVIRLAPGSDGQASLRVCAKTKVASGERKPHKFLVLGTLQDGGALPSAPATLVQVGGPDLPKLMRQVGQWALWALVILFAASMAAALIASNVENGLWADRANFQDLYTNPAVQFLLHLPFAGPVRTLLSWVFQVLRVVPPNLRAN